MASLHGGRAASRGQSEASTVLLESFTLGLALAMAVRTLRHGRLERSRMKIVDLLSAKLPAARVWLSVVSDEWPDYVTNDRDFFAQFQASNYEGLTASGRVIDGERHSGVKPEAYNRALRFVFAPWAANQKRD
jgi:hypothetical protein